MRAVGTCLALTLGLLCVAEFGTRTFIGSPSNAVFHPVLGSTQLPNRMSVNGRAGFSRFMTNAHGLNDEDPSPDAAQRVVVLGDSFVRAIEVDRAQNFTSLVEQRLTGVEVMNTGVAGFNPTLSAVAFRELPESYAAQLVVLVVNAEDVTDMQNDGFELVRDPLGAVVDITYVRHPPGALRWKLAPILRRSAVVTDVLRRFNAPVREFVARFRAAATFRPAEPPVKVEAPPRLSDADLADATEFVITGIGERAEVVVLFVPLATFHAGARTVFDPRSEHARAVFGAAAQRAGVPFLDAGPALAQVYADTGEPPVGFHNVTIGVGHLNAHGHEAVAKLLAHELEPRLQRAGR